MAPSDRTSSLQRTLDEVTTATTDWMRAEVIADDYQSMAPLLEHAISSVVPASDRALMVRYGCEMMERDWRDSLPGMAAFEFQNINLLVTDDYFDERETTRMGTPPISQKWGAKPAIALGFVLKCLSNESLLKGWDDDKGWDVAAAIEVVEWASKWQYYSQFLEDELLAKPLGEVSIGDYQNLVEKATAVGVAGAFELGCIIGGGDSAARKLAREFGMTLGCMLQVRDDCIDYIYNEDLIRKGAFSDLLCRRRRLPVLSIAWHGSATDKQKLEVIFAKESLSLDDAAIVTEMLLAPEVQTAIRAYADELARQASAQLLCIPGPVGTRDELQALVELFRDL